MKKKGFTLVELMGVITVLGLITLLVAPTIINQIRNSKDKIDNVTEKLIYAATDLYLDNKENDYPKYNGSTYCITLKQLVDDGKLSSPILDSTGSEISLDKYINIKVEKKSYTYFIDDECKGNYADVVLNGADPVLREGMIPVTIDASGTVRKADMTKSWYDYDNKIWANAVIVSETNRNMYENANVGTAIAEDDILTYFVWIPRYRYKLWYVEATDGDNGYIDEAKVHSIDIVFEGKNTAKSNGNQNGQYLTHPAFTFGDEELNGIWVGKFETGYNGATTTTEAEVSVADSSKVIIKPNTYSWRKMNVSNMFYTVLNMNATDNIFGLSTDSDTHMMKNTEWGAVAYLSHSKYGKDSKVANNNNSYLTGCGLDLQVVSTSQCEHEYGTKVIDGVYNQSTTDNISGIFDMAGGTWEAVMGYTTSNEDFDLSGFTPETFPSEKYIDNYEFDNVNDYIDNSFAFNTENLKRVGMNYSKRILGDATGELGPFKWRGIFYDPNGIPSLSMSSSWYSNHAATISALFPWYIRGGHLNSLDGGVGMFYFAANQGNGEASGDNNPVDVSFRIVIA